MKLNKFAYIYSKPLGNHTLKIMKKYLEIYFKTWKNHGNIMEFCQSEKVGTLKLCSLTGFLRCSAGVALVAKFETCHYLKTFVAWYTPQCSPLDFQQR